MKLSHAVWGQPRWGVMVERSDRMWSTGEENGKPLQYSCLENPMNSMKRQNDRIQKEELPRSVGAQYAAGDQWRNNSRKMIAVLSGSEFSRADNVLPERRDFVALYRLLAAASTGRLNISDSSAEKILAEKFSPEDNPGFIKYRIMLEVFNELDIFKVEYLPLVSDKDGDRWHLPEDISVIMRGSAEKVNLDDSAILSELRTQMTD